MHDLPEGWQDLEMRQGAKRPRNLYLESDQESWDIGRVDDEELAAEICRRWNGAS